MIGGVRVGGRPPRACGPVEGAGRLVADLDGSAPSGQPVGESIDASPTVPLSPDGTCAGG